MAEIKWIKIVTDIFDNRKIKQIETLPEGDTIIVIWFKLLCLSGRINDNGCIYLTQEVPYTEEMLSTEFNRSLKTIQLAMRTFQTFGMVEIIDDIYHISNWENYQNVDGMERVRELNRLRKQRQREREKLLLAESNVTSRDSHAIDKDKDIEIDNNIYIVEDDNPKEEKSSSKNKDIKREIIDYLNQKIGSDYRSTTKATVQLINARLKEGFNLEDFKKVIDNQYDKWFGTKMEEYLRPQTLFGTKFENYLNTPVKQKETSIERQDEEVYEILDMSEEEYWRSKRNNQ